MSKDLVEVVPADARDGGDRWTPRLRRIACLVALAGTALVFARNELFVADLGHGDTAYVGPISARTSSARLDPEEAEEATARLFTDFGPTPFVAGWAAGLACIAAGGVLALLALWRSRRHRVLWSWLLAWSLPPIGAGVLVLLASWNARATSTPIVFDLLSALALGTTILAGLASAAPWHRLLRPERSSAHDGAKAAAERAGGLAATRGSSADERLGAWGRLQHRRWYVFGGLVAIAGLGALLLGGHRASRYETYEDFLEREQSAADSLRGGRVTRSSLIAAFGEPELIRGDNTNWSDARGEHWYYALRVGGAASLHVLFSKDEDQDRARVRRTNYVDPGEFARIRGRR